jgi:hypothetical protein
MSDQEFWQTVESAGTVEQQLDVFLELIEQEEAESHERDTTKDTDLD